LRERWRVGRKGQSAKLSLIGEHQRPAIVHLKCCALMARCRCVPFDHHNAARHAEMDYQRSVVSEMQKQILSSSPDPDAPSVGQRFIEWTPANLRVAPAPVENDPGKRPSNDERFKGAPDGLDFR
jgi:hypothetical protein